MRSKSEIGEDNEISQEELFRLTKTGLGSIPSPYDVPWSFLIHSNYRADINRDNVVAKLQEDKALQGIVFRPSSSRGCTTISILTTTNGATNLVMSNCELNKLENSYHYYGLNLPSSILEIIKACPSNSIKNISGEFIASELQKKLEVAKYEFERPQRELAERFKMDSY
ncbi:hypothetical protein [Legionella brunensis]|uniref:SH2 domain-containing protein n=1 Tax=Legionella brunensis TaxID=29422 RepID=A0A0W0S341_9GAMM|nr:hypothetical protein [Legionella brunensis]KTC77975.1 hypothetical protein Lbru_2267 [Legionella brunensis]